MNTIPQTGRWNEISSILNDNFSIIGLQLLQMSDASVYNKGVHESLDALTGAYPTPMVGSFAYVGTTTPYSIYTYTANGWGDSGVQGVPTETNFSEITIATEEKPGLMSTNQVKTLKELEQTTAELGQATAEISKKVIESVDVSELDSLVTIPTPANGKADYWLTKMSGGIPIIIGRVFLFEDNMLHKVTQVVMSNQKIDDYYPDGSHAEESLTVYYRFYGHNTVDVPLKQWTPWKKLYDSEDMSPDEIETAISELQLKDKEHDDELQVIGNIVTTEINSIRSSTPVFANIVAGDVDLELSSVTSNYTVVYLENKKVFAALNAGKYWANWRAWGKYPSAGSYGPAPAVGKVYIMGNALYVWNGSSLQEIGDFDDIKKNLDLLAEGLETKAPKVGYAPDLKVDFAKELVGRGVAEPQEIGVIRPTGEISIGDGNATIEKVKGKSVVWNQMIKGNSLKDAGTKHGITLVVNEDQSITISGAVDEDSGSYVEWNYVTPLNAGHIYAISGGYSSDIYIYCGSSASTDAGSGVVFSNTVSSSAAYWPRIRIKKGTVITTPITIYPQLNDLTLMFGAGNEPTTIEEFEARKPLNVSNEYNEGKIISYDAQELKSVGFNAWDEEWELGAYSNSTGSKTNTTTAIRNANPIKVLSSTDYYFTTKATTKRVYFYDQDGLFISYATVGSSNVFTTPPNCEFVNFYISGTSYNNDICIHIVHTGYRNGEYEPYEEDTLQLPNIKAIKDNDGNQLFPYGLLSARSVHDEITATKAVKRIGVMDIGSLDWIYSDSIKGFYAMGLVNVRPSANLMSPRFIMRGVDDVNTTIDKCIYMHGGGILRARDLSYTDPTDFKQAMQGVLLYYELAEPIEVDLPEPLNLTYDAWDFGTEELIAEGKTTPLNADIVYQFNAVDRIRENTTNVSEIEEEVATKQQELTLTVLDNGNIRIGNLQGQTKDFTPATPSGDPMHYAYEALGAVYNSGEDYIAETPWASLVDDADYNAKWGLNLIPNNATFVKTLKYNDVDREVWQMKHPNKDLQIWVVAEYASDGTKIWDDTLVVKRGGMWYMNGLGDLTNKSMINIASDGRPYNASYSGSTNKGRTTQQVNADVNFTVAANFFRNNKTVESLRYGYNHSINSDNIMLGTNIRYVVGQDRGRKVPTFYLDKNLTIATLRYVSFLARANVTFSCELVSARSVIFALNNTTKTITITFPSTLYDRLMDTSTTLGAELVALLESKSNITFARGT